jgi:beta-lactamase class A
MHVAPVTRPARRRRRNIPRLAAALACAAAAVTAGTVALPAAASPPGSRASALAAAPPRPACSAAWPDQSQAHRLALAIGTALRRRADRDDPDYDPLSTVSLAVSDGALGLSCWFRSDIRTYSASAIKATVLAALLLQAQDEHRGLDPWEKNEAWLMITQSDNSAASALWDHVGLPGLQNFLDRAQMHQTELNTWGAWGLTEITAHDETLLLRTLMSPGILTDRSREYALYLMNHVTSSQAWGVRAGSSAQWHIKNGWAQLPDPSSSPWVVNSIGCFGRQGSGYTIVVLTDDNPPPGLSYGIATIEQIARVVHRALAPGSRWDWPGIIRRTGLPPAPW